MTTHMKRRFTPPTDIIERPDGLLIVSEIAGMQPDDFSITLQNRRLIISGERNRSLESLKSYHQLEIGFGRFKLEVELPWTADIDHITATYRDGFLEIELPRLAEKKITFKGDGKNEVKHNNE